MDNYLLDGVVGFNAERLKSGTWLVVHKLHRTPYHVGLIVSNKYYSLTVNGPEINSAQAMIEQLSDQAYNNLMIELKLEKLINPENFFNRELNETDFLSCLFPVRDWLFNCTTDNKFATANNLFELLDVLKGGNFISGLMATRMNFAMEGKIVLMRYDQQTIVKHIKRLKELKNRETT